MQFCVVKQLEQTGTSPVFLQDTMIITQISNMQLHKYQIHNYKNTNTLASTTLASSGVLPHLFLIAYATSSICNKKKKDGGE